MRTAVFCRSLPDIFESAGFRSISNDTYHPTLISFFSVCREQIHFLILDRRQHMGFARKPDCSDTRCGSPARTESSVRACIPRVHRHLARFAASNKQ